MPTPRTQDPAPGATSGRRLATDAERRALASVVRLRILRLCLYEALTNKEIADRLGRDPASVLHHVRTLLHLEFLRAETPRPGPRGSTEVPYRATGKSWELDFGTPDDDGSDPATTDTLLRTFLEEVAEVPRSQLQTTRMGLRLNAAHLEEFDQRMRQLMQEFLDRGPDDDGQPVSVFVAVHPEPLAR
ncbi:Helix-turn-helix domain-containing protein [Nakamurella panacisegetis]|uniref:Helix-turn-helix domain-containing protein n=2 Tax=Nakamurella panacisegetis TaxID=1090615 RepID=A0A1H0Q600_9ACTN|nr:Helix-turn-helix domain-containing protein [Nakamurella panacisegetis]